MFTSYMNPVELKVGMVISFNQTFAEYNKHLIKNEPLLNSYDEFKILELKNTLAYDYATEDNDDGQPSPTIGITKIEHIKSGKILDITDPTLNEPDISWAFVTDCVPDMFKIIK